jgi:hypothetical protein
MLVLRTITLDQEFTGHLPPDLVSRVVVAILSASEMYHSEQSARRLVSAMPLEALSKLNTRCATMSERIRAGAVRDNGLSLVEAWHIMSFGGHEGSLNARLFRPAC